MAATTVAARVCETPGCDKEAKLQCPTCIKLMIQGSFFCSQECFKGFWTEHKKVHKKAKQDTFTNDSYNPWPGFKYTGKLRAFPVSPKRPVPDHIARPDYAEHPEGVPITERQMRGSTNIKILTDEEQEGLRVACKLGREVLDISADTIGVGVTTEEIDRIVHEFSQQPHITIMQDQHGVPYCWIQFQACIDRDCYPSPLNYYCFPKSCCTSVNEVICHGIPDARPLEKGDIVNVDITTFHKGFHGDLNETFFVGEVSEEAKKLVKTTHECLSQAIAEVKPGVRYRDIGNVIQKHAQANGFSVVRSYCGHGIHQLFHTAPSVPHYSKNKAIGVMKAGHSFTIEPMISEGTWRDEMWPDNWTAVTQDGRLSAQFEHTLLVTDTGVDILTQRRANNGQPHFMDQM